jgi:hypothetical protein
MAAQASTRMATVVVELTGTRKLYERCWPSSAEHDEGAGECLLQLAEMFDRKTNKRFVNGYLATCEDMSRAECLMAFTRAHDEEKFFPQPSRLRELSGRAPAGDPLEREAKERLVELLGLMRRYTPGLKAQIKPGVVDRGQKFTEDEIDRPPALPVETDQALRRLGWGDREKGLALLAEHPGVRSIGHASWEGGEQFRTNLLRQADELEKRWVESFRSARGRIAA